MLPKEEKLSKIQLDGIDATEVIFDNTTWDEVVVDDCIFMQANLSKLQTLDVRVENTQFTAARCNDASLMRTVFTKCRLDGVDMSKSVLKEVTFRNCKLDLANFRFAKLHRVRFEDCSLAEADFYSAELKGVEMRGCTLERTIFDTAKIASLDLRGSDIMSLSGWQSLKGATIDNTQLIQAAAHMALEIGIKVEG